MIDPTGSFACRYCGNPIRPKAKGVVPAKCRRPPCRRRYERERKRRYRASQAVARV